MGFSKLKVVISDKLKYSLKHVSTYFKQERKGFRFKIASGFICNNNIPNRKISNHSYAHEKGWKFNNTFLDCTFNNLNFIFSHDIDWVIATSLE